MYTDSLSEITYTQHEYYVCYFAYSDTDPEYKGKHMGQGPGLLPYYVDPVDNKNNGNQQQ